MKLKRPQPKIFELSQEESIALSCALDFLMHASEDSYVQVGFNHRDAFSAAEKNDANEGFFTNAEMQACITSVDLALKALSFQPGLLNEVSEYFPELIPELKKNFSILRSLNRRFQDLQL